MDNLFNDKRIFIDSSSLMHPFIREIINNEFKENIAGGTSKLIISYMVVNELKKISSYKNVEKRNKAIRAIEVLDELIHLNNVMYLGCKEDSFADHNFIDIYLNYGDKIQMVLITQDLKLAKALENITTQNIFTLNRIKLYKINYYKRNLTEWNIKN